MTVFPSFTLVDGGYFVMDGYRGGMMNGFLGGNGIWVSLLFIFWELLFTLLLLLLGISSKKIGNSIGTKKTTCKRTKVTEEEFEKIKKKL